MGFEKATRFLTEHREQLGATIDQTGLVIFFLQRHRVELALKELLVAHRADLKPTHSLDLLWKECKRILYARSEDWNSLNSAGAELVNLLHKHDPNSHSYRYPVDPQGRKHERPKFIDLVALEKHVNAFIETVNSYMASSADARQYEQEMDEEHEKEMIDEYGED